MNKSQRGSILVGVVGLSIVVSIAAGTLLLVTGNSQGEVEEAWRRLQCYQDAEGGLMIGTAWLRYQAAPTAFIQGDPPDWVNDTKNLYTDASGAPFQNGCTVTVDLNHNAVAPPKTVVAKAVFGSYTVRIAWDVSIPAGGGNATDGRPIVTLSNMRYLP